MAMLVASPLVADAADIAAATKETVTPTADVASTSYVKGAYNAAIDEINANRTQINANTTAIATKQAQLTNGTANVSETVKTSVAEAATASDTSLVTEKAVRDAIDGSNSAMDTRVDALETTVGDNTNGLVKDVADLKTTVGDSTSGLVKDVTDLKSAGYITKDVNDLTNYTTTANMNTALAGKQDTIDSTHKLSVDLVDGAAKATDIADMETQTHAAATYATKADLGDKSSLSSDFTEAQKADVVTAVNAAMAQAKTASAAKKVTVHTTWGSDETTAPADVLVNAQ